MRRPAARTARAARLPPGFPPQVCKSAAFRSSSQPPETLFRNGGALLPPFAYGDTHTHAHTHTRTHARRIGRRAAGKERAQRQRQEAGAHGSPFFSLGLFCCVVHRPASSLRRLRSRPNTSAGARPPPPPPAPAPRCRTSCCTFCGEREGGKGRRESSGARHPSFPIRQPVYAPLRPPSLAVFLRRTRPALSPRAGACAARRGAALACCREKRAASRLWPNKARCLTFWGGGARACQSVCHHLGRHSSFFFLSCLAVRSPAFPFPPSPQAQPAAVVVRTWRTAERSFEERRRCDESLTVLRGCHLYGGQRSTPPAQRPRPAPQRLRLRQP